MTLQPIAQSKAWLAQVATGGAGRVKAGLGLAASGFGAAHPLKACAVCMREDVEKYGVAYWHLDHQLPGVAVCTRHRQALCISTDKVSGQRRAEWLLPSHARLSPLPPTPLVNQALAVAETMLSIAQQSASVPLDLETLMRTYSAGFRERFGQPTPGNRAVLLEQLQILVRDSGISGQYRGLGTDGDVSAYAKRLLRVAGLVSPRPSRHPLNHLPLVLCLFDSWPHFLAVYRAVQAQTVEPASTDERPGRAVSRERSKAESRNPLQDKVLAAMAAGQSVSAAANTCGVAVATAQRWAAQAGTALKRRPRQLDAVRTQLMERLLHRGADKSVVAAKASVSVQSVTRFLLTRPALHEVWQAVRVSRAQAIARRDWSRVTRALPSASSTVWRGLAPAAFAWLYRNDRAWLTESIRSRPQPPRSKPLRRDWLARDQVMAQRVRLTAASWTQTRSKERMTLGAICAATDGLRQMLSVLHKLPLTQQALASIGRSVKKKVPSATIGPPQG